jgi:hypothetical protein
MSTLTSILPYVFVVDNCACQERCPYSVFLPKRQHKSAILRSLYSTLIHRTCKAYFVISTTGAEMNNTGLQSLVPVVELCHLLQEATGQLLWLSARDSMVPAYGRMILTQRAVYIYIYIYIYVYISPRFCKRGLNATLCWIELRVANHLTNGALLYVKRWQLRLQESPGWLEHILSLKAFVVCKTEQPPCFSRKIDILWIVWFLDTRGDI